MTLASFAAATSEQLPNSPATPEPAEPRSGSSELLEVPASPPTESPPAVPAEPAAPGPDVALLQQQLAELQQWKQAQEQTYQQQVLQQQRQQADVLYQQTYQQIDQDLKAAFAGEKELPVEELGRITQEIAAARYMQTPQGLADMRNALLSSDWFKETDFFKAGRQHALYETAQELVEEHFAGQLSIASARELRNQLMRYGNPVLMKEAAKLWAENRRGQVRQEVERSGRERVEGGGGTGGGGMTDREFLDRYANPQGGIAPTPENRERARRLLDQGYPPRAWTGR